MAALAQKLNLDDQQKEQFQHIRRQIMEQARSVRNDSALNDKQKREKLRQLRKQAHRQMFSLLTPEQKDRLRQMREEHRKQMESNKTSGAAQAAQKPASSDDDDPFAGMTSDDDDGTGNGS
ncbi:MAG TPA: hypothetical protein VLT16_08245 [Candidatus Limnocylindrales bacterium]|nr:hypothetical protein [Candidatus Limnocylindrales bacterium]